MKERRSCLRRIARSSRDYDSRASKTSRTKASRKRGQQKSNTASLSIAPGACERFRGPKPVHTCTDRIADASRALRRRLSGNRRGRDCYAARSQPAEAAFLREVDNALRLVGGAP